MGRVPTSTTAEFSDDSFSEGLFRYGSDLGIILGSALLIFLIRKVDALPGTDTVLTHGPLDAIGHLLTGLMIGVGLRALRLPIPIWSVLIGSIVLDVGHILSSRDIMAVVAGSSRTGTHSALALIVIASVGFLDQRRANVWLGIAIGGFTHLWRDMGTGTVPLLWPLDLTVDGTTFSRYMIALVGGSLAMVGSGMLLDVYRQSNEQRREAIPESLN